MRCLLVASAMRDAVRHLAFCLPEKLPFAGGLLAGMVKRASSRKAKPEEQLTPRERQILLWVAEGKRDSEIASILNLSVRTVEQHVRTCLRKLNVETRTAASAVFWRQRIRNE
jgi:DNA-binding CsgD family transcriptional regulator